MTKPVARLLGIPPSALPAWGDLVAALDRLADRGHRPPCATDPAAWDGDAQRTARSDAAEACGWCPLLQPCSSYAEAAAEPAHIWGGRDRTPRQGQARVAP